MARLMGRQDKTEINSLTAEQLAERMANAHLPRFRSQQVFTWLHRYGVQSFEQMTNIPNALKTTLHQEYQIHSGSWGETQTSTDGTVKRLFLLHDGLSVETVFLPEQDRATVCVSTQVGCAMDCSFCVTGKQGLARNLQAGEITGQVEQMRDHHVTNVVFMGMGEPLANYHNLTQALQILNAPLGLNIGMRKMTVSTCGLPARIRQLAKDYPQVGLAVSLHAPDNSKRSQVMPINDQYPLEDLMAACRYYVQVTNRRITFEYALMRGFNDGDEDRDRLVSLVQGTLCHINVIPVNPGTNTFSRPDQQTMQRFVAGLSRNHIPTTLRQERGTDIQAACGQLRQKEQEVRHGNS